MSRAESSIQPFALERYFAAFERSVPYNLASSAPQPWTIAELLALEPGAERQLRETSLGYTDPEGGAELREQIAGLYRTVTPDQVVVLASGEEAIFAFMMSWLSPGDHVLVHEPAYQSLAEVARFRGAELTGWQAAADDRWQLDPAFLDHALHRRSRLVVVNAPHNPSGATMAKAAFAYTVAAARRRGVTLFFDEAYRGLELDEAARLPAVCDVYERGVSMGMMSKTWALPGLRIGWLATRDRRVLDAVRVFKDYTTICSSAPSEFLATLALRHSDRVVARARDLQAANAPRVAELLARHPTLFDGEILQSGPICFPRVRAIGGDELADRLRDEAGVLVLPGSVFGYPDHIRIGFGRSEVAAGLEAAEAVLSSPWVQGRLAGPTARPAFSLTETGERLRQEIRRRSTSG